MGRRDLTSLTIFSLKMMDLQQVHLGTMMTSDSDYDSDYDSDDYFPDMSPLKWLRKKRKELALSYQNLKLAKLEEKFAEAQDPKNKKDLDDLKDKRRSSTVEVNAIMISRYKWLTKQLKESDIPYWNLKTKGPLTLAEMEERLAEAQDPKNKKALLKKKSKGKFKYVSQKRKQRDDNEINPFSWNEEANVSYVEFGGGINNNKKKKTEIKNNTTKNNNKKKKGKKRKISNDDNNEKKKRKIVLKKTKNKMEKEFFKDGKKLKVDFNGTIYSAKVLNYNKRSGLLIQYSVDFTEERICIADINARVFAIEEGKSTSLVEGKKMPRSKWLQKQLKDLGIPYYNSKGNLRVAEMEEKLTWAQDPKNKKDLYDLKKKRRKYLPVEVNGIKMPRYKWLRKQLSDLGIPYWNLKTRRPLKVAEMEEKLAWAQDPKNKEELDDLKKSRSTVEVNGIKMSRTEWLRNQLKDLGLSYQKLKVAEMEDLLAWAQDPKNKKDLNDLKDKRRKTCLRVEVNGIKMSRTKWLIKQLKDLGLPIRRGMKVAEMEEKIAWAQDPKNKKDLDDLKKKRTRVTFEVNGIKMCRTHWLIKQLKYLGLSYQKLKVAEMEEKIAWAQDPKNKKDLDDLKGKQRTCSTVEVNGIKMPR